MEIDNWLLNLSDDIHFIINSFLDTRAKLNLSHIINSCVTNKITLHSNRDVVDFINVFDKGKINENTINENSILKTLEIDSYLVKVHKLPITYKSFRELNTLHIGSNNIGNDGILNIVDGLSMLTDLDVHNNNINIDGGIAIAKRIPNLTRLDISYNRISTEGAIAIANNMKYLKELNIEANYIHTLGGLQIAHNMGSNLKSLNIASNSLGWDCIIAISQYLIELVALKIGCNGLINDIINNNVFKSLKNLKVLSIDNSYIHDGNIADIISDSDLNNLTWLDISYNCITDSCIEHIAKILYQLQSLNVSASLSNPSDIERLYNSIKRSYSEAHHCFESMTYLNLSHNRITSDNVPKICELCAQCPNII